MQSIQPNSTGQKTATSHERAAHHVLDFCHSLGIGKTAFYALVKQRKIRTILVGKRRLVPDSELKRLLVEGA